MSSMIRIEAPHFVAGAVLDERGFVVRAAPIIRYMIGWPEIKVYNYCRRKSWHASESST